MRVNLAPNSSFFGGSTVGWLAENEATISYTYDYGFYGVGGLLVTKSGKNGAGVSMNTPIPVTAGLPYAFSVYAKLPLTIPVQEPSTLVLSVTWSNSVGSVVGTNNSGELEVTDDDLWYRLSGVWAAPLGATVATLRIFQPISGTAGQQFVLDALLIEQAAFVGGYFFNHTDEDKYAITQKALSRVPQVINGLRLGADISINNLTLNTIDEYGTIWVCTGLNGWIGQTSPEMPDIGRGTDDGSYDVQGRSTSRGIQLSGFFIPANPDQALTEATDRLVEATNLVRKGGWLRAHSEPTRAAWVRMSGAPSIETINERGRTEFTIVLRAPDPIKYHWNDSDPTGYTRFRMDAADVAGSIVNIGNADVSAVFKMTGPAGPGTRIYNSVTNETITLAEPLRGSAVVGNVISMSAYNGVAVLTTDSYSGIRAGDKVTLVGLPVPFTAPGRVYDIIASSDVFPYSFSFNVNSDDIEEVGTSGQVSLAENDVIVIDTYEKTVTYNDEITGHRYRLVTLTDWLKFGPGVNPIEFFDDPLEVEVRDKSISGTTATIRTNEIHYLVPGDTIKVSLPETAALRRKSLTNNVVTLTTEENHGFAVGDTVDVLSVENSTISYKARVAASSTVTLTTVDENGISVGDLINVSLPATASPVQKSLTGNVALLTTQVPHGFSVGDAVTVALPTSVNISHKGLSGNIVTLTTTGTHGFAVGDNITVTMPAAANIVEKERNGSLAYLRTATAHGFSAGDTVVINLPTTATLTGNLSASGTTNLVTLTTTAAHNFSVGDRLSISHTTAGTTATVNNKAATTTVATLTFTATHNWVVGERISVTGVDSRFNGTHFITAVTTNTVSYASTGAAVTSVASSGSSSNLTRTQDYSGVKIIETIPSSTTFTYRAWDQTVSTSRASTSTTLVNTTNQAYNGTKTLVSSSGDTFAYNY